MARTKEPVVIQRDCIDFDDVAAAVQLDVDTVPGMDRVRQEDDGRDSIEVKTDTVVVDVTHCDAIDREGHAEVSVSGMDREVVLSFRRTCFKSEQGRDYCEYQVEI